jgi:hypothetical protein
MKSVNVVVKSIRAGTAYVVPYSHGEGLQFFRPHGAPRDIYARYEVPAYQVSVSGIGTYRAIRFGLRNNGSRPLLKRPCDAGLSHYRICHPGWIPNLQPSKFLEENPDQARGNSCRERAFSFTKGQDLENSVDH